MQFDDFIAELKRKGEVGAWHFAPATTTAPLSQTLIAINRGGEVHTFTHVEAFGGIIPDLMTTGTTLPPHRLETGPSAVRLSPVLSIAA